MGNEIKKTQLINNSILAAEECRWCSAFNEPHTSACPCGERYKQVQKMGGVPFKASEHPGWKW
jgi:hypothetical protein